MRAVQTRVAGRLGVDASQVHASTSQKILLSVLTADTLDDLSIDVDQADLTVGGESLSLRSLHGGATGLSHVREPDELTAGTLEASAVMSWADASTVSGMSLSWGGGGTIQAVTTADVLGSVVPATLTATPAVAADGTITLQGAQVSIAGTDLPDALAQAVLDDVQDRLALPGLPGGLDYSGLEAAQDGVTVAVSGQGVTLSRLF